ncbi:MAG: nuclear transport factor 2 family protein [Parasphingorhabdus sp.]
MIDEAEKDRRRTLLKIHLEAENRGDIEGVMETFAPDAVMTYNHTEFPNPEAISAAHAYLGFSRMQGAFSPAQNVANNVSLPKPTSLSKVECAVPTKGIS